MQSSEAKDARNLKESPLLTTVLADVRATLLTRLLDSESEYVLKHQGAVLALDEFTEVLYDAIERVLTPE